MMANMQKSVKMILSNCTAFSEWDNAAAFLNGKRTQKIKSLQISPNKKAKNLIVADMKLTSGVNFSARKEEQESKPALKFILRNSGKNRDRQNQMNLKQCIMMNQRISKMKKCHDGTNGMYEDRADALVWGYCL